MFFRRFALRSAANIIGLAVCVFLAYARVVGAEFWPAVPLLLFALGLREIADPTADALDAPATEQR